MLEFAPSCDMPEIAVEFPVDQWEIYMATCAPSGKVYIGLTKSGHELRWYHHVRNARIRRRTGVLHSAIQKHGADSFTVEVLYIANSEREAIAVERGLIAQYGTMHPRGYNLTSGGETFKGTKGFRKPISEKQIALLRRNAAAMRGKPRKPESIEKGRLKIIGKPSPMLGRKHSEASKERMRIVQRAIAHTKPCPQKGKKISAEQSAKRSATLRGLWASPEYKADRLFRFRAARARRIAEKKKNQEAADVFFR